LPYKSLAPGPPTLVGADHTREGADNAKPSATLDSHSLSPRQIECLRWVSEGKSSNDIGAILRISGRTVDSHIQRICERLQVRTRMQAVAVAIESGWI
jgi:DNA-binding CsgD family transcriptional regulator